MSNNKNLPWAKNNGTLLTQFNVLNATGGAAITVDNTGTATLNISGGSGGLVTLYNVKNYGAVGNGVHDDTSAIQSCITANNAAYFPAGNYKVTSTINLTTGCLLLGDSRSLSV